MAIKKRNRLIAVFFVFFLSSVFVFCYLLTQANFVAWVLKNALNKNSVIQVQKVTLSRINWVSTYKVNLENLYVSVKLKESVYEISIPVLNLEDLDGLFDRRPVAVSTRGVQINSKDINLSNLNTSSSLFFKRFNYQSSTSNFNIDLVEYGSYKTTAVKGVVLDNKTLLYLMRSQAQFYGGSLSGVGWIKYKDSLIYDIKMHMDLVDSMKLSVVNENFSQFTAKVNGDFRISNLNNKDLSIEGNIYAPKGGTMKASLLRFMAQYIPQKDQINDLVKKDQRVLFDQARIIVNTITAQKVSSQVSLSSSSLNLNMNVKFDINVEDGFQYLLNLAH